MKRIILLNLVLIVVLAACSSVTAAPATSAPTTVSTSISPTATQPPLATATAIAASTSAAPGIPEFPKYVDPDFTPPEVTAGLYRTPGWFSIPFTFETDQPFGGWGGDDRTGELFGLVQVATHSSVAFFAVDPAYSAEETISLLHDTPHYVFGPNQPVEVAGVSGTQFDMEFEVRGISRIPAIATLTGHLVENYDNNWQISVEHRLRYIVLNVSERVLLIEIDAPKDEFDAFLPVVDQVLGTVKFLTK